MNNPFSKHTEQNVHGWERAASIAGGLLFLGKGLRRGGVGGLLQLALGGMALARGMSGHCEAKRVFGELKSSTSELRGTADQQAGLQGYPLTDADPMTATRATAYDEPLPGATPAATGAPFGTTGMADHEILPGVSGSAAKDDPKPLSGL